MFRRRKEESSASFRSGFTLVELLVVVAIIVVLISIVMPSMVRAREQARRVKCLAQLYSIGQCLQMYANDNKYFLPNGNTSMRWLDYTDTDRVLVFFGQKYVKGSAVFLCPGDDDGLGAQTMITSATHNAQNSVRRSYEFNSVFWAPEFGPKITKMHGGALVWDLDGGSSVPTLVQNHGTRGGNCVFADGHGQWLPAWPYGYTWWRDVSWPQMAHTTYAPGYIDP